MNKPNTAAQAIDRSIRHEEIVTLEAYSNDDYETLLAECDDHINGNKLIEFWGGANGNEWRVHMPQAEE